jgi:hypothetical protein
MKSHKITVAAKFVAGLTAVAVPVASADEGFKTGTTIRNILADSIGTRIGVRLDSRAELEGTVRSIGDQVVFISKLSGRDYFDAYPGIDRFGAGTLKTP